MSALSQGRTAVWSQTKPNLHSTPTALEVIETSKCYTEKKTEKFFLLNIDSSKIYHGDLEDSNYEDDRHTE